jgi:hypothetical protein
MRYLKSYKLFESHSDIIDQCDDILIELRDDGFKTKVSSPADWIVGVYVSKPDFVWSDVKDTLLRLKDFMESNGYILSGELGRCESHSIYDPMTFDVITTKSTTLKFHKNDAVSESVEVDNSKDIITECFLPVSDIVNVSIGEFKNMISVNVNLDSRVSGELKESKWGVEYKPVIDGEYISEEISSAINHCLGEDFVLYRAEVKWKNAGEWSEMNPDKSGIGPGFLEAYFTQRGFIQKSWEMNRRQIVRNVKSSNWTNIKHDTSLVPEFILSRGDMLRSIKLYFQ